MVFSFFKKDSKETKDRGAREGGAPRPRPTPGAGAARPAPPAGAGASKSVGGGRSGFATTENALTNRDFHRTLAMETAAKIDAIESEMTRDFLRPMAQPQAAGASTLAAPAANSAFSPAANKSSSGARTLSDSNTDTDLGNINAIEINTSGAGSVIDETAILFANGLISEAQVGLSAALASDTVGQNVQTAWQMLFELVNQTGNRQAFEQLTMDYVLRFGNSPPSWMEYDYSDATPAAAPAVIAAATPPPSASPAVFDGLPVVRLPETVDASVVKYLEELKAHAAVSPALVLDSAGVRNIDLVGAELLLRVVNAFKRAAHELTLVGLESLCEALQRAVQPGRRESSDASWMLLLEVLRLLERQTDFEETGIQYCITFEVSPPSWEPISPNMKVRLGAPVPAAPAPTSAPAAAAATPASDSNTLQWRGLIEGEGEPHFGRVAMAAQNHQGVLAVECRQLRRMAFSAGSSLLNLALRLQQNGVTLELRNVNALVGALLHLLGVTAVASVQLRRD